MRVTRFNERDLSRITRRVILENEREKRNIGKIIDDIISSFEFSEVGNDEMVEFADFLMDSDNAKKLAQAIHKKLKRGYGAHEDDDKGFGIYSKNRDRLRDFERKIGM